MLLSGVFFRAKNNFRLLYMAENFQNQNLKGKSFREKNLTGEDFTGKDIRGADFTSAVLINTNFSKATAGQRLHWLIVLIVFSLILGLISGYIIAYSGALLSSVMFDTKAQPVGFWTGIVILLLLIISGYVVIKKGIGSAIAVFSIAIALTVVIIAAAGDNEDLIAATIIQTLGFAGIICGVFLSVIAIAVGWRLSKYATVPVIILSLIGCLPGSTEGLEKLEVTNENLTFVALIISSIVALISIALSGYVAWRVVKGDKIYFLIPTITTWLASVGGTSFRNANLTDANFSGAILKSVDFRKANLKRVNWSKTSYLEQSRLEGTYLENSQVRQLVTLKSATEQNFDYLNLRGLNLDGVSFKKASLIGTDFNESSLRKACLAGAKLVKAQLYQTDLTGACLTGAYIQDWGISTETNFDSINCDHIFMRLPTDEDPDVCRKPDNKQEKFKEGDFADFIAPIIKTLDLYQTQNIDTRKIAGKFKTLDLFHHEGIDPSAAAITIQKVAEKYPEAKLDVIALEGRGNEKIRLQTIVSADIKDEVRSKLSEEYSQEYNRIKSLSYNDVLKLLIGFEEKDTQIRSLEKLLKNALQQPKFYVETYQNEGGFIVDKKEVTVSGGTGNIINVADFISDVTNTVNQNINQSNESNEIKDLVKKLTEQIAKVAPSIDPKKAEKMGKNLEALSKEMASSEPERKWYEVSLEGLKEAAEAVGELGKPILETVTKLSPLILAALPK